MRNTTIADNIYHSKRGNVQEGKYNAYMREMTKRKKTHKNAPNITETLSFFR